MTIENFDFNSTMTQEEKTANIKNINVSEIFFQTVINRLGNKRVIKAIKYEIEKYGKKDKIDLIKTRFFPFGIEPPNGLPYIDYTFKFDYFIGHMHHQYEMSDIIQTMSYFQTYTADLYGYFEGWVLVMQKPWITVIKPLDIFIIKKTWMNIILFNTIFIDQIVVNLKSFC